MKHLSRNLILGVFWCFVMTGLTQATLKDSEEFEGNVTEFSLKKRIGLENIPANVTIICDEEEKHVSVYMIDSELRKSIRYTETDDTLKVFGLSNSSRVSRRGTSSNVSISLFSNSEIGGNTNINFSRVFVGDAVEIGSFGSGGKFKVKGVKSFGASSSNTEDLPSMRVIIPPTSVLKLTMNEGTWSLNKPIIDSLILDLSSSAKFNCEQLSSTELKVDTCGSSKVKIEALETTSFTTDSSGNSKVKITRGKIKGKLEACVSGNGRLKQKKGSIQDASLEASGSGKISIPRPKNKLKKDRVGSGTIKILEPK